MVVKSNTVDMTHADLYRRMYRVAKVSILPADKHLTWLFEPNVNPASILVIRRVGSWGTPSDDGVVGEVVVYSEGEFNSRFEPFPERPGLFRERTDVRAIRMTQPFSVTTIRGETEYGQVEDWLAVDVGPDGKPAGGRVIHQEEFRRLYTKV